MRGTLKKLLVILLLLGLSACMTSKKPSATENHNNLPNEGDTTEEEIVFEEPIPETGNETTEEDEPEENCEAVEIIPSELPEALAGEEYDTFVATRGACGFVTCVLTDGPSFLTFNGCQLQGLPDTAESLGEHEITLRAQNMRNESEFVERTLTLTVRDEPKINLFVSSSNLDALKQNVIQKDFPSFDVTLGWNTLYARIEGYADSYTVSFLEEERVALTSIEGNLYSITLAEGVMNPQGTRADIDNIRISVEDGDGNRVERTFDVHFVRDPCEEHLNIVPVAVLKEDGLPGHLTDLERVAGREIQDGNTDVILGTKYRILFQVAGGLGPYEWSEPVSEVWPRITSDIPIPSDYQVLRTNENWEKVSPGDPDWSQVISDRRADQITGEDLENKTYFQLKTEFVFRDKEIPWYFGLIDYMPPNDVYDQLKLEVTDTSCHSPNGEAKKTSYTLKHHFKLRWEGVEEIQCEQEVTDVWDTDSDSRAWVNFRKDYYGPYIGKAEYKIDECVDETMEYKCEEPHAVRAVDGPSSSLSVEEINKVEMEFYDESVKDRYCDDCDHDQADYDLIYLRCETPFRQFTYWDSEHGNQMDDDVTPASDDNSVVPVASGPDMTRRIYELQFSLDHSVWKPRIRPDFGEPSISAP